MALRDVVIVALLLTVGPSAAQGTPLTERECVVHPLSSEVVQQLLAGTNATLKHMEEIKSLLGAHPGDSDRLDVAETADAVQSHISAELLLILLTKLDTEQTRYNQELEKMKEEMRAMNRRNSGGHSISTIPLGPPPSPIPTGGTAPPLRWDSCYSPSDRPRNCHDMLQAGSNQSGVYQIYPYRCGERDIGVRAWCELGDVDGGWTVVLARRPLDVQVNFNRGWRDYRNGFGEPETEYWIGNKALHEMTARQPQVLRVELGDWDGETRWAEYWVFRVDDEDNLFRLNLDQYIGNAGDAFKNHNKMAFTTYDRDNDIHNGGNCAVDYHGGFWYRSCHDMSPMSLLLKKQKSTRGLTWKTWYSDRTTLKNVTFKLRPRPCPYRW